MEDEGAIRMLLDVALTEAGFGVVAAVSGEQARTKLDVDAARLRAVVTDINLGPGLDG